MEKKRAAAPSSIVNALKGDSAVTALGKIQSDNFKEYTIKHKSQISAGSKGNGRELDSQSSISESDEDVSQSVFPVKSQTVALNILSQFISEAPEVRTTFEPKTDTYAPLPNKQQQSKLESQNRYNADNNRFSNADELRDAPRQLGTPPSKVIAGSGNIGERILHSASRIRSKNSGENDTENANLDSRMNNEEIGAEEDFDEFNYAMKPMPGSTTKKGNRKDVIQLRNAMLQALQSIGCDDYEHTFSNDVHGFVKIVEEENEIFTKVFDEVIRQVTVHMIERGELLNEIRHRYSSLFEKIPKHVQSLYLQLVALREMNSRLSSEVQYTRGVLRASGLQIAELQLQPSEPSNLPAIQESESISDDGAAALATNPNREKPLNESADIDSADYDYAQMYKNQRDKAHSELQRVQQDKLLWLDSATILALRLGDETGRSDIASLYRCGHARASAALDCVMALERADLRLALKIEKKILEWKLFIKQLCQSVLTWDIKSKEIIKSMQREMILVSERIENTMPPEEKTTGAKFAGEGEIEKVFAAYDIQVVLQNLRDWITASSKLSNRYSIEQEPIMTNQVKQIRELTNAWFDEVVSLLQAHETTVNGSEYGALLRVAQTIVQQIRAWIDSMQARINGDDGLAKSIIHWQGDIESMFAHFSAQRNANQAETDSSSTLTPLKPTDLIKLRTSVYKWITQSSEILTLVSKNTEKELQSIPLAAMNFLTRLTDQLCTDNNSRSSLNHKIQQDLVGWQVSILVKSGTEAPSAEWDESYRQVRTSMEALNQALSTDTRAYEPLGVKHDISAIIEHTNDWLRISREFLDTEKKVALERVELLKNLDTIDTL